MSEHNRQAPSVLLGWIHPGEVNGRFMQSVLTLYRHDALKPRREQNIVPAGFLQIETGPRIASARNRMIHHFLERTTAEWLLTIDTDMVFEPQHFEHLLSVADAKERPIVGGLCFGGGHGSVFPTMYRTVDPAENNGEIIGWVTDWEPGSLVRVEATGAAFLLMHRSALVKIGESQGDSPYPWFSEGAWHGREFGEDWMFCLRAMRLGIPIYVDTACQIGHMKSVELNEEMWRSGTSSLVSKGEPAAEPQRELRVVGGV